MSPLTLVRRFLSVVALIGAAAFASGQGAATAEEQAAAPTPDGPPTYIGRGPALPNLLENVSNGPTPRTALLVNEKGGGLLAIIDPDKLEIVARVYFGGGPHEVATDGRYAYISAASPDSLTVVDVLKQTLAEPIAVSAFGTFHGLWQAGGNIYIAHENTQMLSRYNPKLKEFDWARGIGMGTHLLIVTPDEKTIYIASSSAKEFAILESATPITSSFAATRGAVGGRGGNRGAAPAAAGAAPAGTAAQRGGGGGRAGWTTTVFPTTDARLEGFAISPDGTEYWGLNINEKTLMIASIPDKQIIDTIPLDTVFSNRLRFTRDGKYVLISELMGPHPTMMIYDAKTHRLVKRLDPGAGGEGILVDPRPEKAQAFYAVSNGNKIAVIDTKTLTIKKYIEGLRTPDGMDWYQAK